MAWKGEIVGRGDDDDDDYRAVLCLTSYLLARHLY